MRMGDRVPPQLQRFKEAARESGADMSKEEFAHVVGELAKPKAPAKEADEDQAVDD